MLLPEVTIPVYPGGKPPLSGKNADYHHICFIGVATEAKSGLVKCCKSQSWFSGPARTQAVILSPCRGQS